MRARWLGALGLVAACGGGGSTTPGPAPRTAVAPRTPSPRAPAARPSVVPTRPVRPILVVGATLWTADGRILDDTDLLLAGGRIAALGRGLPRPAEAIVWDGRGKHVTPGLVDPHGHLGVYPAPALRAHADGNEVGRPVVAEVRAEDAFWPQDPGIRRALEAGVTTALSIPGSANLVGGQGFTFKLKPGLSARALRFPGAPASLKLACGENPKRVYAGRGGPSTRMGNVARLRAALQAAREYRETWRRWEAKRSAPAPRPGSRAEPGKRPDPAPQAPKRDLGLETLVGLLEGRVRAQWHCYRADEMLLMMRLAEEFGFRVAAFHHAVETYKIPRSLARHGAAAVTWIGWWGLKAELLDAIPENAALVTAGGAVAAMHSDSATVAQHLNQEAALAYHRGRDAGLPVTRDDAIRFVTRNPARVLGIEPLTGALVPGRMADVVLWDRDPFSAYARPEKVVIDGEVWFDRIAAPGGRPTDFELGYVPRVGLLPGGAPAANAFPPAAAPLEPLARDRDPKRPLVLANGLIPAPRGGRPTRGSVVVQDGRIVAVGEAVRAPAGADTLDVSGHAITPGFVAEGATLGRQEITIEESASDLLRASRHPEPVRAALRAWDGLDPLSAAIPVTRVEGFTSAVVRPTGGLVSGQGAAVALDDAGTLLKAPAALYVSLGLAGARAVGGDRAFALLRLRRLLADARVYHASRQAMEARRVRVLSASYADCDALGPVLARKVPVVVEAHRAADLLAALSWAREEKVRLVLTGAGEAWRVADRIARDGVPVFVEVEQNLPDSFENLAARWDNAARLHRAGVTVGITAGSRAHDVRELRQLAAIAVAWGLPHHAALAALTAVPAAAFGLTDLGGLRPGARADLVVWNGDPLELGTRARLVLIGGRPVDPRTRQTRLLDRYLRRPRRAARSR